MGEPVTECWCIQPRHEDEVECSKCKKHVHYECLGLSMNQLSRLWNQTPGIYFCKTCSPQLKKTAREAFLRGNPGNSIFEFNAAMLSIVNGPPVPTLIDVPTLQKAIDERFIPFETKITSSVVDVTAHLSENMRSYASVTQSALNSAITPQTLGNKAQAHARQAVHRAEPERSILISKVHEPLRFAPKSVKVSFNEIWPDSIAHISHARILNSGKLLIEARSTKDRDDLLSFMPHACFGPESSARAIDSQGPSIGKWVLLTGLDSAMEVNDALALVAAEYPSATDASFLPAKLGARSRALKCRISESSECSRIFTHGVFGSFCHYRAKPFVDRPRRCYKCQRFGHVSAVCRSSKRCCKCGSQDADHPDQCAAAAKCCNCNGDHSADSFKCPTFTDRLNSLKSAVRDA